MKAEQFATRRSCATKGGSVNAIDYEVVRRHVVRWADRVVTRTQADDPHRVPWDRRKFMEELHDDDPGLPLAGVADVTDRFERCVDRANKTLNGAMTPEGRSARLRQL